MLEFTNQFDALPGVNTQKGEDPARANLENGDNNVYAYSTPTNLKLNCKTPKLNEGEVAIKFGQTHEQTLEERVDQQDGARSDEEIIRMLFLENVDFTDKEFHQFLDQCDKDSYDIRKHNDGKNSEWYSFRSVEDFCELLNEFVNGVEGKKESYPLRKHQKEAIRKMNIAWDNGYDEFLLAAKMRFGKNFTFLCEIRNEHEQNNKEQTRALVTTYRPNVFESVKDEIDGHVLFEDFEYIDLKKYNKNIKYCKSLPEPKTDADVVVYLASAQLVMTNTDDESAYKVLEDEHFDFVVADEVHYGCGTSKFSKHFVDKNYFTYDKIIWMSGTPFRFAKMKSFGERNSYYFTYLEEQRLKKSSKETWADDMPTLKFHMMDVSDRVVENQDRFFNRDERFRFDKLFATDEDGNFEYRAAVKNFFRQISPEFIKRDLSPYRICDKHDHSLWMLPKNVDAVEAAKDVLSEMPEYEDFKIFVAAGDGGTDRNGDPIIESSDIGHIKKEIKNDNLADKTITLSCGRFKEGTTVEEWHMALMLNDEKSAESYFQTVFRPATPVDGKDFAHIFDFNPERTLHVFFEATESEEFGCGDSHTERISELLDCALMIDHRENGFQDIDAENVMETFFDNTDMSERLGSLGNIDEDSIDLTMAKAVTNLDEAAREISQSLNENGTKGGKKEDVTIEGQNSNSGKSAREEIRRCIQTALENLTVYLLVSDKNEESVNEIIQKANKDQFERQVGISIEQFEQIKPALDPNIEKINRQIQEFVYYQKQKNEITYD